MASSLFLSGNGDGYELQMGRWSRRLAPVFFQFSGAASGMRVLDVGCGTGSLSHALAADPRVQAIHGIDMSAIYVDHARRRSSDPRLHFEVADACAVPYADETFDQALSLLVLQFIPAPDRAVAEMRRVTHSGGTVAAATWDTETMPVHRLFFGAAAEVDPRAKKIRIEGCERPMATREGLLQAWRRAGLEEVASERLSVSMDFAAFADFWAPIEGHDGPYAQYFHTLDQNVGSAVRERVRMAYLAGEPDGARSYPAHAWAVRGVVA